jgi:hypothetical protein
MAAAEILAAIAPDDFLGPIIESRAFSVGLVYGALGFLATGIVAAIRHRTTEGGGLAFAAAVFLGVRDAFGTESMSVGLIVAIALLALGGSLAMRMRSRIGSRWYVSFVRTSVALLPGAAVLTLTFPLGTPTWLRFAAGGGTIVCGALVHDFDATQGPKGAPFVFLAVATIGVYFTLPDTELPLVMMGAALPLVLISAPQPLRRLGPAGTAAAMGTFAWVVVVGGRGRPGSVVAGFATLGILLVEPLGRRIPKSTFALGKRKHRPPQDRWLAVIAVAAIAQLALNAYCATMSGRENDAALALLMTAPVLVLMGAAAPYLLPLEPGPDAAGRMRRGRHRKYAWMH